MRTFIIKIFITLIFLTLSTFNVKADNDCDCKDKPYYIGDSLFNNNKIILALNSYNKELTTALNNNDTANIYSGYIRVGSVYEQLNDYKKTEEQYYKAFEIATKTKNLKDLSDINNRYGTLYFYDNNMEKAYDFFIKTKEYAEKLNDKRAVSVAYNNIGEIFMKKNNLKKALEYYNKSLEINIILNDCIMLSALYENIGLIHHKNGELNMALESYMLALNYANDYNNKTNITTIYNKIGRLYYDENDFKNALINLNKSYDFATKTSSPEYIKDVSKNLSDLYYSISDFKNAYKYFQVYLTNLEKINKLSDDKKITFFENKYKLQKISKENELLEQKNKSKSLAIYLIISVSLLVLIILAYFVKILITKYKTTKSQKNIAETNIKSKSIIINDLKDNITEKNTELINFALYIIHKNDLMKKIKSDLKKIKSTEGKSSKDIRNILMKINQSQKLSDEYYKSTIEEANKDFLIKLKEKFPDLTNNETQLAVLLRINLSSKEIALLNNVSIKAIEMSRYRLRKKINLSANEDLSKLFNNI